jgi:anti-anti-sigma factor
MPLMSLEAAELTPQAWCIRIRGEVDSSNLERLKTAFDAIFARKVYKVVVNLQNAKYISSSGIGCLIGAFTTAIKNGGRFVIAAAPLQITEVLNLIGLGGVLRFAKDEASALGQLT